MNTMMAQKADFEKKIKEFEEQLADEEQFADEIETIKVKGEEKMNKMRAFFELHRCGDCTPSILSWGFMRLSSQIGCGGIVVGASR